MPRTQEITSDDRNSLLLQTFELLRVDGDLREELPNKYRRGAG